MRQPKRIISALEACDEAAALLKHAGFVHRNTSMASEASYYQLPGCHGCVRVATHGRRLRDQMIGLGQIHANLTFEPDRLRRVPGTLVLGAEKLHERVCAAIGRYMLAQARPERRNYDGPKEDAK